MNDPNDRSMMNEPHHICPTCGHLWKHGESGSHSCAVLLSNRLALAVEALQLMFEQYCSAGLSSDGRNLFQHFHMSAGEEAADVLIAEHRITSDQVLD